MTNRRAFWIRGCVAIATASLLGAGVAQAQPGPTSGMAGGPSNGYGGVDRLPPASSANTPTTGGGPTTRVDGSVKNEQSGSMKDQSGSQTEPASVTGSVQAIDPHSGMMTLDSVPHPLRVSPDVAITRDGSKASLEDIRPGDQVRASFDQSGSSAKVQHIDVIGGGSRTSGSGTGSGTSTRGSDSERSWKSPGPGTPPSSSGTGSSGSSSSSGSSR